MTYGFKMANSVTDLRVTGKKPFINIIHKFYIWICFLLKSLSLFLGMLKDVEDDMQRRVKVYIFFSFFGIGYLYSSKWQVNFS